jgi:hypothetical protein
LRVILTVNNNTFCFATIDKVFYYVASVLTTIFCKFTWWWPNIRAETCREYRSYLIKYFVNCCEKEGIIIYSWYSSLFHSQHVPALSGHLQVNHNILYLVTHLQKTIATSTDPLFLILQMVSVHFY